MRILIIEDDPNKLEQLRGFVRMLYPEAEVLHALSYNSGLQQVLSSDWSVVLLDMQLPTFDKSPSEPGGRQRALAGQQILRRMLRDNLTTPVIVVTQFEQFGEGSEAISLAELVKALEGGNFQNYVGTVYYHANISDWKRGLQSLIEQAVRRK